MTQRERGSAPQWPEQFPCSGDCGFMRAGVGMECRDGSACSRYLHPGDPYFDVVRRYYDETERAERPVE